MSRNQGPDRTPRNWQLVIGKLQHQIGILHSISPGRTSQSFEMFDIKQMLQAEVFDSESVEAADNLSKNGFTRAAGSLAGVVLEKHLQASRRKSFHLIEKDYDPTISDFNDALKRTMELQLDIPTWSPDTRCTGGRTLQEISALIAKS